MAAIRQTFFQECDEQLVELEGGLLAIEAGEGDGETVNAVFRAVHSIKGGAGAFNLLDLVGFAHAFENVLDALRTGRLAAEPALVKTMLRATDFLTDLVRASRDALPVDTARSADLVAALAACLGGPATPGQGADAAPAEEEVTFVPLAVDLSDFADLLDLGTPAPAPAPRHRIRFRPRPELYAKGSETALLFRELDRLGPLTVACDTSALPPLEALDPEGAHLAWTLELAGAADAAAIHDIFDLAEWDSELAIERVGAHEPDAEPEEPGAGEGEGDVPWPTLAALGLVPEPEPDPEPPAAPPPAPRPPAGPAPEPPAGAGEAGRKAPASATIRVELDRVDRLINLAGELVINQAMLSERAGEVGLARRSAVASGLEELEQLTRDIQDSVMAIRAQPVRAVFQRLPRLVREVAAQTGKSVRLVTEGEATEVDKIVIEHLGDPLTHMIRNAIDHGLEDPDTRLGSGKPAEGCVRVTASHRSGRIVIEVSDDGHGIDRPRVRQIATAKGLIPADAKLTDEEVDNLIFLPGFSTAATVSDISGRGVGMDVVKRAIQSLGGRIAIASRPGEGSTFTLSLPLTLAVLDGMALTVAGQTFLVPLSAVVEILMPQGVQVHGFSDEARVIGLRGAFVPLVDVGHRLALRPAPLAPREGIVLLLETDGGVPVGLVVDAIQGQRQVVIKSLEANYGKVPGIAAATILGDGRVALILDVDALASDHPSDRPSDRPLPLNDLPPPPGAPMTAQAPREPRELVTFLVGRHEFCVDIMAVREIRGWTPATPLPHTPSYVRGVINLRGAVLSIIDLATRLGLPAQEPTPRHVIIVVQAGDQLAGLLVDAVTGILSAQGHTIQPPPPAPAATDAGAVQGVLAIDNHMISLVNLTHIIPTIDRLAA